MVVLDGGVGKEDGALWTAQHCGDLLEEGLRETKRALKEDFEFHSMFQEWIDTTLDGKLHCNTATDYTGGSKNHEGVKNAVERKRREGMVCNKCILNGKQDSCQIHSFGKCCNNCECDPTCGPDDPCVYQFTTHVFSDQGSEQRKALGELHDEHLELGLEDSDYCQQGFGGLHQDKNFTGAFRNYRITDGHSGSFCITDLIAVACSDTGGAAMPHLHDYDTLDMVCPAVAIARELVEATILDVFQYKDRHHDYTCYLTSYPATQQLFAQCQYIKAQELPNCYRPWAALANNHDLLRRPHHIVCNSRGDRIFSEVENHFIGMHTCHNPPKFKVICGTWNHPGKAKQGMGTESQAQLPGQIALLPITPGREEYVYFCDTGNCEIRRLSGAHSYDAPHCVNTVKLRNTPGALQIDPPNYC